MVYFLCFPELLLFKQMLYGYHFVEFFFQMFEFEKVCYVLEKTCVFVRLSVTLNLLFIYIYIYKRLLKLMLM